MIKIINFLFWIVCLTTYISCITPKENSNQKEDQMTHKSETNTNEVELVFGNPEKIDHGNITLAIGNIWEKESEEGKPIITAGLWVYFKDDKEKNIHHRIKEKQEIDAGKYLIRVIQIPSKETVVLGVSEK